MNTNPLDRRLAKLEQEYDRRSKAMEARLFEPAPPFSVKMSDQDAFRKYLEDEQSGALYTMRESNGGWRRDEDVDSYVSWGTRMKARFAPSMLLKDVVGRASVASGGPPLELPELPEHEVEDWGPPADVDEDFTES